MLVDDLGDLVVLRALRGHDNDIVDTPDGLCALDHSGKERPATQVGDGTPEAVVEVTRACMTTTVRPLSKNHPSLAYEHRVHPIKRNRRGTIPGVRWPIPVIDPIGPEIHASQSATDLDTRAGAINWAQLAALGLQRDPSGWGHRTGHEGHTTHLVRERSPPGSLTHLLFD